MLFRSLTGVVTHGLGAAYKFGMERLFVLWKSIKNVLVFLIEKCYTILTDENCTASAALINLPPTVILYKNSDICVHRERV